VGTYGYSLNHCGYGTALSMPLPFRSFVLRVVDDEEDAAQILQDVISASDDGETAAFIECDIEYPAELHDLHNSFPCAPEKMVPPPPSPMQQRLHRRCGRTISNFPKLIAHLGQHSKYVCHSKTLQLYLRLGLRVSRIHRIVSFEQKDWLKSYIELNTELRQAATNAFEKSFFKLMNNALYGLAGLQNHL
jgi:hypothetical protein